MIKNVSMLQLVAEGGHFPRGYAVAWWYPNRAEAACLPLGIHLIAGWMRQCYIRFRSLHAPDLIESAYVRGVEYGRQNAAITARIQQESDQRAADAQRKLAFREGYHHCLAVLRADVDRVPSPEPPEWFMR